MWRVNGAKITKLDPGLGRESQSRFSTARHRSVICQTYRPHKAFANHAEQRSGP
jgi:hypothetical protein